MEDALVLARAQMHALCAEGMGCRGVASSRVTECKFLMRRASPFAQASKEEGAEDGKRRSSQSSAGQPSGNLLMRLLSRTSGSGRRKSVEGAPGQALPYITAPLVSVLLS